LKVRNFRSIIFVISTFLLLFGCTSEPTTNSKKVTKPQSQKQKQSLDKDAKQDGKFISMVKINVPQTYDLQSYRMTYWSAGEKVVAYVALPKVGGIYQMFIGLHGGYSLPSTKQSVSNIVDNGKIHTYDSSMIKDSQLSTITLIPMYRGYEKSEGTIHGLAEDTLDTNNAIKSLKSYLLSHKNGPQLEKDHIYLSGISLGGGVALKLASERNDIVYAIAISPFVGWDISGQWYKDHNIGMFDSMKEAYGTFIPTVDNYKSNSIDYKKIKVPVLLVQGTDDPNVPWQTVQTFYNELRSNNQNVTFKLIKGGDHGLDNKKELLNQAMNNFIQKNLAG
jgi:dienelactone hydrolase